MYLVNLMNEETKITLSERELNLVCNTEWILTKHIIIEKVYQLFGTTANSMQDFINYYPNILPMVIRESNAKISRGENYRQLPYVMLDYPRYFTKDSTLAIRTFFWWGNFFSITLQLSGGYKDKLLPVLTKSFSYLQSRDYWLCVHADPWHHHFDEDNYVSLKNFTENEFLSTINCEPFLKIAKKLPLEQWDTATIFIENSFKEIIELLGPNFPNDETDL